MPTSTHGLNGPFPLVNGPFSDLNGAFPRFRPKGPFYLLLKARLGWAKNKKLKFCFRVFVAADFLAHFLCNSHLGFGGDRRTGPLTRTYTTSIASYRHKQIKKKKKWQNSPQSSAPSGPFYLLKSVKVRRGRREGDGTENVMTERPSHARWFCP